MSKADGQYIAIRFTEKITSDPSGLAPAPIGGYGYASKDGTATASASTNPASNMVDGNTSTYWYQTNAAGMWIQLQLSTAKIATGMRWHMNSASSGFKDFVLSGSNDGTNFTQLGSFTDTSVAGWKEFNFSSNATAFRFYRMTASTYYGTYSFIDEVELKTAPIGNEGAFTVSGQEYTYEPGGELIPMVYPALSVAAHSTDEYAILLAVQPLKRFERVKGNLTVSYDASKGNLAGQGGPVASFTQQFLPTDLINKPHPHDPEHIEIAAISISAPLIRIYYSDYQAGDERIQMTSITATGVLTNINDL